MLALLVSPHVGSELINYLPSPASRSALTADTAIAGGITKLPADTICLLKKLYGHCGSKVVFLFIYYYYLFLRRKRGTLV